MLDTRAVLGVCDRNIGSSSGVYRPPPFGRLPRPLSCIENCCCLFGGCWSPLDFCGFGVLLERGLYRPHAMGSRRPLPRPRFLLGGYSSTLPMLVRFQAIGPLSRAISMQSLDVRKDGATLAVVGLVEAVYPWANCSKLKQPLLLGTARNIPIQALIQPLELL